jgi:flagellar basal-body rod modification protein FlgD
MATSSILPGVSGSSVVAGTTSGGQNIPAPWNKNGDTSNTIAGNFTQFLQLLTTQLKNQNPMDPLDTNQFTQQLVQFAQVEQQLKSNDELSTLVSLQQTAQTTQALGFVGNTVTVDGKTAALANGKADWTFNVPKPSTATVTISDASGNTAYSGTFTVQTGQQQFSWDGKGTDGKQWPAGNYTISVTAKDTNGQSVAMSTQVVGVVDSVDLTQTPPMLSVAGQNFSINQVKAISRTVSQ